ncbi:MAG: hypothetical protein HY074_09235 [Deltaproteobacteria bacterium]|nr:hypothetical protein [Deltaproteobacteria bacterium]
MKLTFRGVLALPLLAIGLMTASTNAAAWDVHALITHQSLLGFKFRDAAFWNELNTEVTVTPIEDFITKAFGTTCTWNKMKDSVLEGVGRGYKVTYAEGITYHFEVEWNRGISRQIIQPVISEQNPQGVGRHVKPLEVISIYSDEPDWNMDDDVPQLRGKGIAEAGEGTATRTLRHFWYEGENSFGVDFGKDQHTDRRAQLFYELALIAFEVHEPYWGYRFIANALHYIQDMTQPYHTKALISDSLIDKISLIRAKLCEWHKSENCGDDFTLSSQVIKNAWVVGAYHGAFEDFARGLFAPSSSFATYSYVSDFNGYYEKLPTTEKLPWVSPAMSPLIDFRDIIRAEQQIINNFATKIGDYSYNTFGFKARYDTQATQKAVLATGSNDSDAYRMATLWSFGLEYLNMTSRQQKYLPLLVEQAHEVLMRAGVWSRQLIKQTMTQSTDDAVRAVIEKHRAAFQKKCESPPSP